MIRDLDNKPEIFSHLGDHHLFYELYDEKGIYGYGAFDIRYLPDLVFHLEITRFNHFVYTNLKDYDWDEAKMLMKKLGATRVIVNHVSDAKDSLFSKFVTNFGFSKPVKYITAYQEL